MNGSSAEHAEHEEGEEHHPYVILFLMVSFATGVLVRGIIKKLTWFKLPYTILVLAIPGMCIAAAMTAVLATFLFDYYWNFKEGLLFGAVTAATDPVAVVSLLREVGASKPLSMLIEGESLMNDGSAIVLFLIMLDICKGTAEVAVGPILARFCQIAIGGPIFGIACGHFFVFWLSRIFNDAVSEITLTIVAAYFTFYVGEVLLGAAMVMMFFPLLSRIGYGLSWQSALVIIWGGLRGAVGSSRWRSSSTRTRCSAPAVTRNVTIHRA
ncbi:Sodium/hydrogen exchanger 7 [Amphibalanus amphitrite]|uniref:Sodium/hydrogen exchanger 7 n=1 Tax=Amphibalanus amphitrite TaxID=1232801 RepID=A0A6A4UX56_AMPAM|nr:Sodium/hydrogen exchanger 7 [Amphibalanus amphitrite]KAF0287206.1 Sodium/hydrogen exchanger 7 [Amphibalanus amphitrite]